ncbi:MAG TPA: GAF domain-containing SpoIIE family protein phosphatase [Streptosporangiaceae bacterium]|nr:GAF domain-containing SpoIIE family protein phosphatase [Streptosporangiaceae bacterium]
MTRSMPAARSAAEKLRDLQSIADAALSRMEPEKLLDELLDRVKDILQGDTAAVLLLDQASGQLIATAARGLEEEVRQNVRIPLGGGFAGRVAAEQHPVILDHVDHSNVLNPILTQKGIQSLIGVPMLASGRVIGVLHVGTLRPRKFTAEDADLLQLAADRAAAAVQSVTGRNDRAAAAALQRSLVPSAPPWVPGMELAGRYVPGEGHVGGDWYDVFPLPSGQVCAVIGDVAGSGLPAAVIMGRMRSTLRAYAMETADPAEILARLDAKMRHFEPGALATVLCAVFDRDLGQVAVSTAGHLPPIVIRPGQPAAVAELRPDLMIGVTYAGPRHVKKLDMPPGATLCLFTDGLVERRDSPLDDELEKLCSVLAAGPADAVCRAAMAAMTSGAPADDIALLVLTRQPADQPDS